MRDAHTREILASLRLPDRGGQGVVTFQTPGTDQLDRPQVRLQRGIRRALEQFANFEGDTRKAAEAHRLPRAAG